MRMNAVILIELAIIQIILFTFIVVRPTKQPSSNCPVITGCEAAAKRFVLEGACS